MNSAGDILLKTETSHKTGANCMSSHRSVCYTNLHIANLKQLFYTLQSWQAANRPTEDYNQEQQNVKDALAAQAAKRYALATRAYWLAGIFSSFPPAVASHVEPKQQVLSTSSCWNARRIVCADVHWRQLPRLRNSSLRAEGTGSDISSRRSTSGRCRASAALPTFLFSPRRC